MKLAKLLRYAAVSGVSTATSQIVLATLVATRATSPVVANVIATVIGTVPSFELNRRWVWGKHGRRSLAGEVAPFAALAAAGLGLSTLAVAIMSRWAEHFSAATRTMSIEAASLAAFGAVWLVQFVVLDRVLFKHRGSTPQAAVASATAG
jgi:putative flippase GtrA